MPVAIEKRARAAYLTFSRPPLNVFDLALLRELGATLESLKGDESLNFLVLSGGGERAFSAGVDVGDHTRARVPEMLDTVHGVMRTLFELPQVTVAAVRGACLGGGCELASCCDLVVASDESFFATPEIDVGCYPPVALARFWSEIGYHRAAEMILTGRRLSAQEALTLGLVNRVVPRAELERAVEELLEELRQKSAAVLRIALRALREIALRNFLAALKRSEDIYLRDLLATEDVEEGVRAFLEKRKPFWKHR
ncbi:MAG TPA: enoyl-CoA hydratase-related protein [Candidatus Acidoferrales bacterium]|nr:enoyl-CoA hydratase-related protein [Candidatus Acidoferrales bacterium]